jgi:hypothetical protein
MVMPEPLVVVQFHPDNKVSVLLKTPSHDAVVLRGTTEDVIAALKKAWTNIVFALGGV